MSIGALIVGHGSRSGRANAEFEQLVSAFAARHPELEVAHGYVELAQPSLPDALIALGARCHEVVVVPLFLFAAGHVKNDLPLALARARQQLPHTRFWAAEALGIHAELVALVRARAAQALPAGADVTKSAVLFVGRGSSDPEANADVCKLARLVAENAPYANVLPAFMGVTRPDISAGLELLARARPERIVVLPYLIFAGRLIERMEHLVVEFRQHHPWIAVHRAEALGGGPELQRALDERFERGRSGTGRLACDTCQYRVPVAGLAERVGGLQALLWSLRHGHTHSQAAPHVHAHGRLTKHVLVCGNADCAERGSVVLLGTLRRLIKRADRARDIRVTRTHCMGRCGEGPTLVVYPDGIWYRNVSAEDAATLVDEHLLHDRLLARRVDQIM